MATTTLAAPEWLTKRDCSVQPGIRDDVLFVLLAGKPQYRLDVRPAKGTFTCAVLQTVNGKSVGDATTYATPEAALAGGLDQLRNRLGW